MKEFALLTRIKKEKEKKKKPESAEAGARRLLASFTAIFTTL